MYLLCTDIRPSQDHRILSMQTVRINLADVCRFFFNVFTSVSPFTLLFAFSLAVNWLLDFKHKCSHHHLLEKQQRQEERSCSADSPYGHHHLSVDLDSDGWQEGQILAVWVCGTDKHCSCSAWRILRHLWKICRIQNLCCEILWLRCEWKEQNCHYLLEQICLFPYSITSNYHQIWYPN